MNNAALDHRKRGQLDEAERLLKQAIEIEDAQVAPDSPTRPNGRNNLAIVLMRAGKLEEAGRWNAEAWRLKAGQHDLTSGRILFVRIALRLLLGDCDVRLHVGQLKTLLARPGVPERHRDDLGYPRCARDAPREARSRRRGAAHADRRRTQRPHASRLARIVNRPRRRGIISSSRRRLFTPPLSYPLLDG